MRPLYERGHPVRIKEYAKMIRNNREMGALHAMWPSLSIAIIGKTT